MAPASSPYAVFKASDWSPAVVSPVDYRQCLKLDVKRAYARKQIQKKKVGNISPKIRLKDHVQLAFA
ncbi:hypothetical protein [Prochlorococcus marinus]|uniref:hypothetical protein n=1 Tax=Prochlorococcus marinus TaxID=1219 RepID=UPI0000672986|nr:hypothetical protein [Prochlorococcus marinus]